MSNKIGLIITSCITHYFVLVNSMATLYTHKNSNIQKTWLLMIFFLGLVIALGWVFAYTYNNSAILYGAVAFAVLMNVASYWYSDKIVVRTTGAYPADETTYKELHRIVENLAITAGLPKPRIYIINDAAPNALATGRNPENAAVAVTTGLLAILDRAELEGVLSHELSHVGNRDILVGTVAVVLVGFIAILSDFFLRMNIFGGDRRDRGQAGMVLMVIGIALSILAPIVATLMQLAISRKREFLADASGALLTRYPEGLANALKKIHEHGAPLRRASNATAHLFIANPFGPAVHGISKLFMSHPPVEDRITALLGK